MLPCSCSINIISYNYEEKLQFILVDVVSNWDDCWAWPLSGLIIGLTSGSSGVGIDGCF